MLPQMLLGVLVQVGGMVLEEDSRISINRAQRSSQVVGDRVSKCLHLLVGGFELGGTLLHPLLQRFVEPTDFLLRTLAVGDVFERHETKYSGAPDSLFPGQP